MYTFLSGYSGEEGGPAPGEGTNIIVVPGGVGVTGTQHSQHHCGTRRSGCYRYTALITSLWYQEELVLQVHSTYNIIVVPGGVGVTDTQH